MQDEAIRVSLVEGKQVDVHLVSRTIHTGSEDAESDRNEPTPLELFRGAVGASAGCAVLDFCLRRGVPTEGIEIAVSTGGNSEGPHGSGVDIEVTVPAGFPAPFREDLVRAAENCEVGRLVTHPPALTVRTRTETREAEGNSPRKDKPPL